MCCRYLASLRGHVSAVYQISWSADSRLLCSGSSDSTLKVWDMKTRALLTDLPGHADEVTTQIFIHLSICHNCYNCYSISVLHHSALHHRYLQWTGVLTGRGWPVEGETEY